MKKQEETTINLFHKYVYIFFFCCVIGFTIETIWCFIKNGYIESRQSLVYGPFSVAYGMGGILLTFVLGKFKKSSNIKIFFIAFLAGTITEYICSLGQEIVFGSVAWDYSHLPLNINGRVCLLYSLFWGIIGIAWVKLILPFTDKLVSKIPIKLSKVLVTSFIIFFIFDVVISASAALRMNERAKNLPPSNIYEQFLDKEFTDERMKEIYANSKKVE
ncbi:MAG: putative ABC transporter permease [Clostridia bacterium]|nr:putative ABC transporter permease [Clostridia bacterium]